MLNPVSTRMDDRLLAGKYITKPTRSTQPCIPLGSLNQVRTLHVIGWGKGRNVISAGWQVYNTVIPYGTLVTVVVMLIVANCYIYTFKFTLIFYFTVISNLPVAVFSLITTYHLPIRPTPV